MKHTMIVMMGGQGAGKGSLATIMKSEHEYKHIESGALFRTLPADSEIAKMFNTTSTHIYSLRTGKVHTDITKDYDMTIVKNPNLHRSKLK